MASDMEPRALNSPRLDPAWKHCQSFKNDGRIQLKCLYCGKIFKGGGISRFKEHLAGQKGNGLTCLRVHPDVRQQMLEILNIAPSKSRKKLKLAEEKPGYDSPVISGVEVAVSSRGLISDGNVDVDEHMSGSKIVRKNQESFTKALDVVSTDIAAVAAMNPKKVSLVDMAVGRFFFNVGLSADAVNSPYFQPMIDAIASQGAGVVGPSYHDLRSFILKNSVHEVRYDVDQCTAAWERTGCSILVSEWSSGKCRTFISLFAYCPQGTIFLRSADISCAIDTADVLYGLLKETVEQVGLRNVLQVVTSGEERYFTAGKRLTDTYPSIFWTPCAGSCIELMLQDIGELPRVKMILDQAKSISRFIYSDASTINMIRRYTSGLDLIDLGTTRSSTDFMTLKRMINVRHYLQSMVTSEEWMGSSYSKKTEGFAVLDAICSLSFWSTCDAILRLTDPLLRLLRVVSSQKMPSMGFVYAGLYRVKEAIKKELVTRREYLVYWKIIDHRWEHLQRHPLHAAGFYLNPNFFYSLKGDEQFHIRSLVYDCIEKLVPDSNIQDIIMRETTSYHIGTGDFGRKMAIRARGTVHPTEWWLTYGGGCPNLARLAIRILSQTCCLIQHKVDKVHIEQMYEWKNWLENQRLGDLVYVQQNMNLKHMVSGNGQQKVVDPLSSEHIDLVEDWVMEKEFCFEGSENKGWMDIEPPYRNVMPLGPQIDDVEAFNGGFDDYEIFYGVKDSEENGDNTGNTNGTTVFLGMS